MSDQFKREEQGRTKPVRWWWAIFIGAILFTLVVALFFLRH